MATVLVLGGDGYLGWPTAMSLSAAGHDVHLADNYLRRRLAVCTDNDPLWEAPNLQSRCDLWHRRSGRQVTPHIVDLAERSDCDQLFAEVRPDTVVHYAEQPSAPYSMLNDAAASLTLHNNVGVTLNVVLAIHRHVPDCHLVKLGTMGEYGTPACDIPEGWFEFEFRGRKHRSLFPRAAGSLYHTTKVMDTDLLWFYTRIWKLRVTDLMQGPVYGIETEENTGCPDLYPCFAYDELFGTVLNRFIVQAVAGHPLTVYGKGGQTRGYLNIRDTLNCIKLAIGTPASQGELRVFNQFTETFSVNQLAELVRSSADAAGLGPVQVTRIENPRVELEDHYYNPDHTGLLDLGLKPHYLTEDCLSRMIAIVAANRDRIKPHRIFRGVRWK